MNGRDLTWKPSIDAKWSPSSTWANNVTMLLAWFISRSEKDEKSYKMVQKGLEDLCRRTSEEDYIVGEGKRYF